MRYIKIVYFKELLDTIRDRRTIISMIVVPVFVFPLLTLGFASFTSKMVAKSAEEIQPVAVIGAQYSPELYALADISEKINIVDINPDSIESSINDKLVRAVLIIPEHFSERIISNDSTSVTIVSNDADTKSNFAAINVRKLVMQYQETVVNNRLVERGVDPAITESFVVEEKNVSEEKMGSYLLSMFIPYIIIILSMVGAMYTAIDLTAGEKERGTLETILVSPIPRWQLATGKFLTILTTSIVSTVMVLGSMSATMFLGLMSSPGMDEFAKFEITPLMIFIIFLMMIPTACLLSAVIMSIAMFAKSHKEAQSYVSPLMFIVILPSMVSFMPGVELNIQLAFVPLVNICLSIKEAMMGSVNWLYIAIIFISTVIYAAFAIFVTHRLYEKESVLFRT